MFQKTLQVSVLVILNILFWSMLIMGWQLRHTYTVAASAKEFEQQENMRFQKTDSYFNTYQKPIQ